MAEGILIFSTCITNDVWLMDIFWIFAYLLLGGVTGLCAGLFGIGGGGIMVPALAFMFTRQDFAPDQLLHIALATSMAAIVPTSLASARAHHRRNAVLWPVVKIITPGVLLGTFAATFLASELAAAPLAIFFSVFMGGVALQMVLDRKPTPSRQLPGPVGLSLVGTGIGGVSALVAIGGGSLTVPFLAWCNVRLQSAIGTSAAVGIPIALAGATGYIVNGWSVSGLPAFTLGFVYWPAVVAIAAASFITAPLGSALAHRLPVPTLKKMFALLLALLAIQMLVSVSGS
jgi:uncharacterized membrane protein YfcA